MTTRASNRSSLVVWLSSVLGLLLWGASAAFASEAVHLEDMTPDLTDKPSLQRGARLFVDYCLGCHSLKYQRYERTADDLGVPHELFEKYMIFTGQKIGGLMANAVPQETSKNWFGAPPPDLTMVTKVRGEDWVYTYLKSFYVDDSRPFGVNNAVFENVGMPHALLELQGVVRKGCEMVPEMTPDGRAERRDPLEPGKPILHEECGRLIHEQGTGLLTPEEFDRAVYDVTNFLYYVGEPARLDRYRIGVYVLLFLVVLYVFVYLLAREYRKEVH